MRYRVISADCHIDLPWLPPDLFVSYASPALKDRMPHVTDSPKGSIWVTKSGSSFGLVNGMGAAGREYVPGQIHRSDRMAATGLYDDGKKGIRRLTDPDLRLRDQDRDGVQAEVLYGILGASMRLNDPEAAAEVCRIYNEWLADFCAAHPDRYVGLACIPSHDVSVAVEEVRRVVKRGAVRGIEVASAPDMPPFWDPVWHSLWEVTSEARLPVHFHTIGGKLPERVRRVLFPGASPPAGTEQDVTPLEPQIARAAFAVHITGFQLQMATVLMSLIFGGVLERYPDLRVVIGESGIGWLPYVLNRMDAEWEDQFKDLPLKLPPSAYWRRQCKATYQTDPIGIKLIEELGPETVMWGSDFPHPDGVWPDSQEYIQRELGHLPEAIRHRVICENAAQLYGLPLD